MNAKEAREMAESLANETNKAMLADVMSTIENSVKKGLFYCSYYKSINETVKKFLKTEGYTVKYQSDFRNDGNYVISW